MERQGDDVERELCLADRLCQLSLNQRETKPTLTCFPKWSFHSNEITEGQYINHKY